MDDFIQSIKVTSEDKQNMMINVLNTVINCSTVPSINDIVGNIKDIKVKLTDDEILAIYSLSISIQEQLKTGNHYQKLFDYLTLDLYPNINKENLLTFINQAVLDIKDTKARNPKIKWYLQTGKIFARLDGKNPYKEEIEIEKDKDKHKGNGIIIKYR